MNSVSVEVGCPTTCKGSEEGYLKALSRHTHSIQCEQVNEKIFPFQRGNIRGWYKKEGDKTGMNGCMLP